MTNLDALKEWIRITGKLVDMVEEPAPKEDTAPKQQKEVKDSAPEVKEAPKPEPKKEAPKKSDAASKQQKPKGREPMELDDGKIGALYKAGWSLAAIADEMGVSRTAVNARLKKLGIKE